MRREIATILIGLAGDAIIAIGGILIMPNHWLLYSGLAVFTLVFLIGVGMFIWPSKKKVEPESDARKREQVDLEVQPNVIAQPVQTEDVTTTVQSRSWITPSGNTAGTVYPSTDNILDVPDYIPKDYGPSYERYYLPFKNLPIEAKRIRDATDVHAAITISSDENWTYSHELARWLGQPVPGMPQPVIVISSNGQTKSLYLAIRQRGTSGFYIFNDRSYTDGHIDPTKDELEMKGHVFNFNIELRDKDGWHKVYIVKMTIQNLVPTFEVIPT